MLKKALILSFSLGFATGVFASVDSVKYKLSKQYPNVKIENLKSTEMQGLYSGTLDNQIVYIDENAEHIFIGSMIRLKDQRNLTKDLVVKTNINTINNRIDFNTLPKQDAIKTVRGTGKRQIAIFSDPNCPYCKALESNLAKLNDVTIYTFIYPIKKESVTEAKQVWCSANKEYAWKSLLQYGIKPSALATCNTPIERNLELGKRLRLDGTPAIIFSSGDKLMGAYPADKIEQILKELGS